MGLKIYNDLIGATNKGKFPAIQGSSWSSNMFQEENGGQNYMASLPGLKLERSTGIRGRVQGVYVSSVGETAIGGAPEMFAVVNGRVMRFTPDGRMSVIGSVSMNNARVSFAETGGLRPFLLIADGQNLFAWNLTESYWLQIQMPPRAVGEGQVTPSFVQCVDGSIVINDVGTNYFYFSIRFPLNTEKRKVFDMSGGEVQYETDGVTVKMVELPSESIVFLDSYHCRNTIQAIPLRTTSMHWRLSVICCTCSEAALSKYGRGVLASMNSGCVQVIRLTFRTVSRRLLAWP